jgi:tRNA-uridine 2-sulfurtransferase
MLEKPKKVFVGLSGGVDSSVAALRLKSAGYEVYGVFIKVWQPDFLVCNWEAERLDAMRIAAQLDIPFLTCDAETVYRDSVAQYFIDEYLNGRTPNPDVMCNKHVKFRAFLDFALNQGADYIATGHYAQCIEAAGTFNLLRGVDTDKDQSYFLWTLTQEQLARVLLPVGTSTKAIIREEAAAAELTTASKKDSQGICFLGHVDIPDFLGHYTDLQPGDVLAENGERIGTHKGALVYTVGQRHGFSIINQESTSQPHYVVARNLETNTITVSTLKPKAKQSTELRLERVNWISKILPTTISIQMRYRQHPISAAIQSYDNQHAILTLNEEAETPSVGQSCVLYDGDVCLGGGIIA